MLDRWAGGNCRGSGRPTRNATRLVCCVEVSHENTIGTDNLSTHSRISTRITSSIEADFHTIRAEQPFQQVLPKS